MTPIRRFALHRHPIGQLVWLGTLAACAGQEGAPQGSVDARTRPTVSQPPAPGDAAEPAALGNTATADCEDGATAGPDAGDVLSRNEIRSWARPDQPSRRPCKSGSTSPVADTVQPIEALAADSTEAAQPEGRGGVSDPVAAAPAGASGVPLVPGLTLISAHRFPDGDRENVVVVEEVSPAGVTYAWSLRQRDKSGGSSEHLFARFVRANDLESAPRLDDVFITRPGRSESPGYTAFSISRATYVRVRADGQAPYTVTWVQGGPFQGGPFHSLVGDLLQSRVRLKGTLSRVSATPQPMPVLLNGRRVSVPVLHLKGRYAFQEQKREQDYWVLADSAHPILLRIITGPDTLQTVRIQVPQASAGAAETLENDLVRECRGELPGVYFAFASAELESASGPALAGVAALLGRHPDWSLAIEGHTDSIGDPRSNQTLSVRRAEAVRAALIERHGVAAGRLQAAGFGASRPREPNATLEGRARNRRVELVRACADERG